MFGGSMSQAIRREDKKTTVNAWKLKEVASDLFIIGTRIENSTDSGSPTALRKLLLSFFDSYEQQCYAQGFSNEVVEESKFALCAYIDECIRNKGGELYEFWSNESLSLTYFKDSIAGETFYLRLQELQKRPYENISIIEVYYLCLALGFEGHYKLTDPGKAQEVQRSLWKLIESISGHTSNSFSPSAGVHPGEPPSEKNSRVWLLVALILFIISIIFCFSLMYMVNLKTEVMTDLLRTFLNNFQGSLD